MDRPNGISLFSLSFLLLACTSAQPPSPDLSASSVITIRAIQGRSHKSPHEGERVEGVEGVATAVLSSGRAPGFWMQDPKNDRDDATSEAIFISTKDAAVAVKAGDAVSVSGKVEELGFSGGLTTTQITKPEVRILASGRTLPLAIVIGAAGRRIPDAVIDDDAMKSFEPRSDAIDFWESLEGMRVEVRNAVVVGPSSSFGDMVVLADRGRNSTVRSPRGGIVVQESDWNPERIVVEPRLISTPPTVNVGDRFSGPITGVVDYNFGNFRLLNTEPLPFTIGNPAIPEVTALSGDRDHVTVATYNLLNISAASNDEKFRRVGKTVAINLGSPDLIGLQEVQDDSGPAADGVVSAEKTFARLIDAIVREGGPRYDYRQIDPVNDQDGGQPGGNIRVGLLFNPQRVTFVDRGRGGASDETITEGSGPDTRLLLSPGRVDPLNPCFAGGSSGALAEPTRKSLASELRFHGRALFVIVNHLKSKRGDDALFGANQPPAFHTEHQRDCQAGSIGRFAASILAGDPSAAVVLLGDLNEHEFRRPVRSLVELSGLVGLIDRVPLRERYTFVYDGNGQVLDHIMVSPSLFENEAPEIDIVHVNADRADAIAASDHDPVVARVRM